MDKKEQIKEFLTYEQEAAERFLREVAEFIAIIEIQLVALKNLKKEEPSINKVVVYLPAEKKCIEEKIDKAIERLKRDEKVFLYIAREASEAKKALREIKENKLEEFF